jgi:NAD(P)-dependent dehydrogenase (short-subunit alcohol dehydrogenase family)
MGRLSGKIAFITGVASGQGRAAAKMFAAEGAVVVGCDIDQVGAEQVVSEVHAAGHRMMTFGPVDLGSPAATQQWIADGLAETGGIDILYNNAAGARFGTVDRLCADDWAFTLHHELSIVFYAVQTAWPHLIARGGGAVLNTASAVILRGNPDLGLAAHAAGKGGVIALTQQLAAEGAAHKIRVNTISPGPVKRPASKMSAEMIERIRAGIPLGRWGESEDIAYCALYLASDEARWVTGANFVIDGGYNSVA